MKFEKKERPISKDVAEEQFLSWLDAYDVDAYAFKESHPEEFVAVENSYNNMIARIERGLITVKGNDSGGVNIIQKLQSGDEVEYKHMTCLHLIARDKHDGHEMRKNALLAAMSGKPASFFEEMKWGIDAKTADMVYSFFLFDY